MKAVIFRLQLFKPSEAFISTQVRALPNTESLLIGRKLFGPPPGDLNYWVPESMDVWDAISMTGLGNVGSMLPAIRNFKPDVIHAHFAVDALYALTFKRSLDVPLVTTLHGFDVTTRRREFIASRRPSLIRYALLQNQLKRESDLFLCVSDFVYKSALAAGFPQDRLHRHYIGVDPKQFEPPRLGCADRTNILHIARLVEKKGTSYLIEAFSKIAGKFPESRLVIVGDGPLRASLESLASSLGIRSRVDFRGARPHADVRRELNECLFLALPSVTASNGDSEGLGIVLLEAAATGIPVVGTRHGGIPEAVLDQETGLLVEERSVSDLADSLDRLLGDRDLCARLGRAGRTFAETRFNVNLQSAALRDIYTRVIRKASRVNVSS